MAADAGSPSTSGAALIQAVRRTISIVMSSNCGALPAKRSIASTARGDHVASAGSPADRRSASSRRSSPNSSSDSLLRVGDAVGEEHERVARLEHDVGCP